MSDGREGARPARAKDGYGMTAIDVIGHSLSVLGTLCIFVGIARYGRR